MLKRTVSVLMLTLLLTGMLTLSFNVDIVVAYKSGPDATHRFIFDQARTILQNDGYVSYAEFLNSIESSSGLTYLEIMKKASDERDKLGEFPYIFPLDYYCFNHYMDPTDHHRLEYGIIGWKSAGQLCQERINWALSQWNSGEYYDAIWNLGWATHLVQDVCVPHHAYPTWQQGHDTYELWVLDNMASFAVENGGIYSFPSFPDRQFYVPQHFIGVNTSAFDWVDYNAHESIKYWGFVNYYGAHDSTSPVIGDWAENDYFVETVHNLPNNVNTTWIVEQPGASQIMLHFQTIDVETNFDYVYILDGNNTVVQTFTGKHSNNWTLPVTGDTLKIKVTTDYSVESWGYRTDSIKFFDTTHNLYSATMELLSLAQRTTAGFIKFFFDKVLNPIYIRADGSVEPSTAPIQRDGDIYTFTSDINNPIVVEKDNIVINGNGRTLQATYNVGDGFYLSGKSNVTIQNVTVKGFWSGICVWDSNNISLTSNTLINNKYATKLHYSSNNLIANNNIINNYRGAWLVYSSGNTITGNNLTNNDDYGIVLSNSSNNTMNDNNITSNSKSGIYLISSLGNTLTGNKLTSNGWDGVWLSSSNNITLTGNDIKLNHWGIYLSSSFGNIIYHNNIINNTIQVYSYATTNIWDNGYPSGGNYWSDYNGTDLFSGPNQSETGSDGIGDTPYVLNATNQDNYPLTKPYPWALHDIGIMSVTTSREVVGQGCNVSINVMIFNYGNNTETFNVTILANSTIIGKIDNINLQSRNFTILSHTWNTTGFAKGNYTIWAYAWPVLGETYTADNTFTEGWVIVTIPGDVNGDHLADISDLVITVGAIPSSPTINPEIWNPNADINNDGVCDVADLVICVGNIPSSW